MTDDEATRSAGAPDAAAAAHRDAPAAQPPAEGASGAGLPASARSRRAETGSAYAAAGVDTEAGDAAVELMRAAVGRTLTGRVVGGLGGFAGMVDVSDLRAYRRPLLATSTDGVGTKIAIARALDVHDTIGQDLVGMVVDDIAVVGARPLLMTDYIACGRVVPERIADIVRGVARACRAVDVPLLGGETAEHPGLMAPEEYDIAGAATGVVEADAVLGAERVRRATSCSPWRLRDCTPMGTRSCAASWPTPGGRWNGTSPNSGARSARSSSSRRACTRRCAWTSPGVWKSTPSPT